VLQQLYLCFPKDRALSTTYLLPSLSKASGLFAVIFDIYRLSKPAVSLQHGTVLIKLWVVLTARVLCLHDIF
jgi:hypothetical protein